MRPQKKLRKKLKNCFRPKWHWPKLNKNNYVQKIKPFKRRAKKRKNETPKKRKNERLKKRKKERPKKRKNERPKNRQDDGPTPT